MSEKKLFGKSYIVFLIAEVIHAANMNDTVSGFYPALQAVCNCPTIQAFCGDMRYRGTFVDDVQTVLHRRIDISERIKPREWKVLPLPWKVERTFSWLGHYRRLSKDYEISPRSSENAIKVSHIRTLLKRLCL